MNSNWDSHNHGPAEGRGLDCGEKPIGWCVRLAKDAELADLRAEVERLQGVVDALAKQNVDDAERWSDVLAEAEAKVDLNVTAATSAIETHQLREAEQCQRAEAAERALADERAKVAELSSRPAEIDLLAAEAERDDAEAKVARVEALAVRFQSIDDFAHLDHRGAGMLTAGDAAKVIRAALDGAP
jgi:hypothetical protein